MARNVMGTLLDFFFPRVEEERAFVIPPYDLARIMQGDYSYRSAGMMVDVDAAMRHDAYWACVTRIAQDVAMMPADVVRYRGTTREEVSPTPQIIADPSDIATALDWRYQVIVSWLTAGNAWGLVTETTPDVRYPTRINLVPPAKVRVTQNGDKLEFYVNEIEQRFWPLGKLWHVPAYTLPGQILGMSPTEKHALEIGIGLASAKFGSDFFQDGGHPTAIVGIEGQPTEEQARTLKEKLLGITRGNRELLVLPKSTTYTPMQVNPEESQFLNTMRYSVEQICRIFGEDPADYGASGGGTSVTYANRSDADLARFKRRQFWVTKLQDALTDLLPRPQVVKLNTSSALMMTAKERWDIHVLRLQNKTTTINEVRALEDEKPFPDPLYDQPGVMGGTQPLGQTIKEITPGVGVLLTSDEGRAILNENGADLVIPGPPDLEPAKAITPAGAALNGGGNGNTP